MNQRYGAKVTQGIALQAFIADSTTAAVTRTDINGFLTNGVVGEIAFFRAKDNTQYAPAVGGTAPVAAQKIAKGDQFYIGQIRVENGKKRLKRSTILTGSAVRKTTRAYTAGVRHASNFAPTLQAGDSLLVSVVETTATVHPLPNWTFQVDFVTDTATTLGKLKQAIEGKLPYIPSDIPVTVATTATAATLTASEDNIHFVVSVAVERSGDVIAVPVTVTNFKKTSGTPAQVQDLEVEGDIWEGYRTGNEAFGAEYGKPTSMVNGAGQYDIHTLNFTNTTASKGAPLVETKYIGNIVLAVSGAAAKTAVSDALADL